MKKWFYFIVPTIGMVIFLFFYYSFAEQAEQAEKDRKAEVARKTEEEKARKAALEERARLDAEKKAKERAEEAEKKEAEKKARWDEQGQKIQEETDDAIKTSSELTAKIAGQEKMLAELRAKKDRTNRDLVETAKLVELAKVERRVAEMNIQRTTALIAKKAEDSALAAPPPLPVAPAK